MAEAIPFKPKMEGLSVNGCGRDAENEKALCFYFNRKVTDDEMRFLHEVIARGISFAGTKL